MTFWADDFDGDLYKLVPSVADAIKSMAAVELLTHGSASNGSLTHPSVWNTNNGLTAFFGTRTPCKPRGFWTDDPIVKCTAQQAIRDCWCHGYEMVVNGWPVWNTGPLQHVLMDLLWVSRKWPQWEERNALSQEHRTLVTMSVVSAVTNLVTALERGTEVPA